MKHDVYMIDYWLVDCIIPIFIKFKMEEDAERLRNSGTWKQYHLMTRCHDDHYQIMDIWEYISIKHGSMRMYIFIKSRIYENVFLSNHGCIKIYFHQILDLWEYICTEVELSRGIQTKRSQSRSVSTGSSRSWYFDNRGERGWLLGVRERERIIPFQKFGKGKGMEKNTYPKFRNGIGVKKTFPKFGNGNGMKKSIPKIREQEGNEKNPFPHFGNGHQRLFFPGIPRNGNGIGKETKYDNKRTLRKYVAWEGVLAQTFSTPSSSILDNPPSSCCCRGHF